MVSNHDLHFELVEIQHHQKCYVQIVMLGRQHVLDEIQIVLGIDRCQQGHRDTAVPGPRPGTQEGPGDICGTCLQPARHNNIRRQ